MPNELNLLDRIGAPIKALVESRGSRLPYSTYGWGGGAFTSSASSDFYHSSAPGAKYDYRAEAGELIENPVVAVCVRTVAEALSAAPPVLQEKKGSEWVKVEDDDVTGLLNTPMPGQDGAASNGYGGVHLWGATAAYESTQGQAFWLVEWNKSRKAPRELRIENPRNIRIHATPKAFIDKYQLLIDGKPHDLKNEQIIHFRAALHHYNPRMGWCPLQTGHRQVAGDNSSATYHGALLRNHAAMSAIMTLQFSPESAQAAQVDPADFERIGKSLQQRYSGEGAGGLGYVNYPIDIKKLGLNPEEMALDKLIDYYERRICALIGVDPMVVGLGGGTAHRTYANMSEALKDFWERRIQPHKFRHSSELGAQLLPLFGLDPANYRIAWDYSQIEALNENTDERHTRIDNDYKSGVIDLFTAQTERGIADVPETYKGVFHPSATVGNPEAAPLDPQEIEKQRRLEEAAKSWNDADIARIEAQGDEAIKALAFGIKAREFNEDDWKRAGGRFHRFVGRALESHQQAAFDFLSAPLGNAAEGEPYREALRDALQYMPEEATKRIRENVKSVEYHATPEEMHRRLDDPMFPQYPEGGYDSATGGLFLNERNASREYRQELYAHELSHAIDGIKEKLSSSAEWKSAWEKELGDGQLLDNSTISPREGFADFGATIYSDIPHDKIKAVYPQCYNFWKERRLI